ncbi:hypothetical protein B566_EDAN002225 [Ephemera danica]|nr:hypothetical protein B566_EDAN002225 [Ephemera danica]
MDFSHFGRAIREGRGKMADLEAVLADVSYLMAMEKSKCTPAARASKKIILPDPRYEHQGRGEGRPQIDTGDERERPGYTLRSM